jgi:hypothetical protein
VALGLGVAPLCNRRRGQLSILFCVADAGSHLRPCPGDPSDRRALELLRDAGGFSVRAGSPT